MAWRPRFDVRLATQVLLLQVAVVVLTLGIAGGLLAFLSHQRIHAEVGQRALDVARVLAFAPAVRADVARYDDTGLPKGPAATDELANGQLQLIASEVQKRTDVLFVVFTNDQGIRLAHPNRDELGKPVSTDPAEALAGRETVVAQSGTLGPSVRAKVPILRPNSQQVVGEVSVGISTSAVHKQLWTDVRTAAVLVGVALLIGIVGSVPAGQALARTDVGAPALRTGRDGPRSGGGAARYRRGSAGRRHLVEDDLRQRRGMPPARDR